MRGAAGNVKKVALELGGKSPNIVFADADFETAVDNALTAAFVHSGQVCSAGCRAIVEDAIYDRLVAELGRRADRIRLGHGLDDGDRGRRADHAPSTGPRSRATWRRRSRRAPGSSPAAAARPSPSCRPASSTGRRSSPTSDRGMRIVREEVFGPVLTIERFTTEEEAIALGNDTTYGLAGRGLDRRRRPGPAGRRRGSATGRSGSTTTTPTCRRPSGAASSSPGSGGSSARSVSTSTARPSTSGRTRRPAPAGWFGG